MALSHLLDTSVLIRLRHPLVREVVEPLVVAGLAARARISDLEIGYAARNVDEWDRLLQALDVLVPVDTTQRHVRRALQLQRILASKSQRGRKIPDLLIAAAAEEMGFAVLHYDRDFDLVSSVTGQRCEWVVLPGTID